jgi:hypothetical protein
MPTPQTCHAIVTMSFQSSAQVNQATHEALTGVKQGSGGSEPFRKPGTACYTASGQDKDAVLAALQRALAAAAAHAHALDSIMISMSVDRPDELQ